MNPSLSIVFPVYNEESLLVSLINEVIKFSEQVTPDFEIIAVNDGSTDNSLQILVQQHKKDSRVKVLDLSRNFGHQAGFSAGLQYAKGDFIIMMDADFQDPPDLIPELYKVINEKNYDIVYGKRTGRKEAVTRKMLISLFHRIFSFLSQSKAPKDVGNFCIMNRRAVDSFLTLNEKNRYLPGLRFFIGFDQGYVEYERPMRESGKPKMSVLKLFRLAFDAIFSFSKIPIRISLILGILGIIISLVGIGIVFYKKIIGDAITGWTSTMLSIYFLGSVQLFFLGILGEYVYRIYKETQNRPVFIVKNFYS